MIAVMRTGQNVREILTTFRENWKVFLGIHVAANVIWVLALTPLYTLPTGWLVLASGKRFMVQSASLLGGRIKTVQ